MPLWSGPPAGRDLADVHIGEVAATAAERIRAERVHARPARDLDRQQVEAEVLVRRDALGTDEVGVWIREERRRACALLRATRRVSRRACGLARSSRTTCRAFC